MKTLDLKEMEIVITGFILQNKLASSDCRKRAKEGIQKLKVVFITSAVFYSVA